MMYNQYPIERKTYPVLSFIIGMLFIVVVLQLMNADPINTILNNAIPMLSHLDIGSITSKAHLTINSIPTAVNVVHNGINTIIPSPLPTNIPTPTFTKEVYSSIVSIITTPPTDVPTPINNVCHTDVIVVLKGNLPIGQVQGYGQTCILARENAHALAADMLAQVTH